MTSRPGASAFERLRALQDEAAFLGALLEKLSAQDEERARLKAAAARAGQIEDELRETRVRLPGKPGRPLDEIPPSFVQEILRLHDEYGWGRPRILDAMRDRGVTERHVRRVLAQHAGQNPYPAKRSP